MTSAPKEGFRVKKRWIVGLLILAGIFVAYVPGPWHVPVVRPAVFLPPEKIPGASLFGLVPLTNTMIAMFLVDAVLLVWAFGAWRRTRAGGQVVPGGMYNVLEAIIEFLYNTAESTAGKWARRILPVIATIFLMVLIGNWMELIPGVDSIGVLEPAHAGVQGYAPKHLFGPLYTVDGTAPQPMDAAQAEGEHAAAEGEHGLCESCFVTPFVRALATDLNFPAALAVTSVVLTQVFGVWALGGNYFKKFWNTDTMFTVPMFGVIDFAVGLLELVSELSKILSFTFRLFGNIFAGQLLIFVLASLVTVIVPSALFMLELFVGAIQAYVFAMLTLVFMGQAVTSHHGAGHGEHPTEAAHADAGHAPGSPAPAH